MSRVNFRSFFFSFVSLDLCLPTHLGVEVIVVLYHTHTTLGRTPLDERSARRRDLYLTTHNTHKRQTSMPPAGFEHPIPASERPQTQALDRAATGIDSRVNMNRIYLTLRTNWLLDFVQSQSQD
jgi:hypothetical protein